MTAALGRAIPGALRPAFDRPSASFALASAVISATGSDLPPSIPMSAVSPCQGPRPLGSNGRRTARMDGCEEGRLCRVKAGLLIMP